MRGRHPRRLEPLRTRRGPERVRSPISILARYVPSSASREVIPISGLLEPNGLAGGTPGRSFPPAVFPVARRVSPARPSDVDASRVSFGSDSYPYDEWILLAKRDLADRPVPGVVENRRNDIPGGRMRRSVRGGNHARPPEDFEEYEGQEQPATLVQAEVGLGIGSRRRLHLL